MSFFVLEGISEVEEQFSIQWNILEYGNAINTLESQWDIFNNITQELECQWNILEVTVEKSLVLKWDIYNFIDDVELALLWEIFEYEFPEYQFKVEKRIKSFM